MIIYLQIRKLRHLCLNNCPETPDQEEADLDSSRQSSSKAAPLTTALPWGFSSTCIKTRFLLGTVGGADGAQGDPAMGAAGGGGCEQITIHSTLNRNVSRITK